MQTPHTLYTTPKLCTTDKKDWFVHFRFWHAGIWHPIKKRENINRIKDKTEKRKEGEALREAREIWLKAGWNPVIDPEFKLQKIKSTKQKQGMLWFEAMTLALSKKELADKSFLGYQSQLKFMQEQAELHGYSLLQITDVDRGTCLDLLDKCKEKRNFSNDNYNKHAETLRSMFTELLDRRIIDVNPLHQFRAKEVPESNKYQSYTEDEKEQIARHLLERHYGLYRVMELGYHTGIRPKEVLALKIDEIDLRSRFITIVPDFERENSKTNKVRRVPINRFLADMFGTMQLHKYPQNYYVFGSPFKPGQGNRGAGTQKRFEGIDRPGKIDNCKYSSGKSGAMRDDFLTPSPNPVKRDTVTKLWKKLIIDELGINKYLYGAKYTGTDDKIDAGLLLSEIQIMFGHASEAMTVRYNKRKRLIGAKTAILDKSPAFINPAKQAKLRKVS